MKLSRWYRGCWLEQAILHLKTVLLGCAIFLALVLLRTMSNVQAIPLAFIDMMRTPMPILAIRCLRRSIISDTPYLDLGPVNAAGSCDIIVGGESSRLLGWTLGTFL